MSSRFGRVSTFGVAVLFLLALATSARAGGPADLAESSGSLPPPLVSGHTYQASDFQPSIRIKIVDDGWNGAQFQEGTARGIELVYLGDPRIEVIGALILISKPGGTVKSVLAAIRETPGLKTLENIRGRIGPVPAVGVACRATGDTTISAVLPDFTLDRGHPCRVLVAKIKGRTVISWTDASREQFKQVSQQATAILTRLRFP
jgi:hypothetical protein